MSYSISSGAIGIPDLVLPYFMIALALHNTSHHTNNNPYIFQPLNQHRYEGEGALQTLHTAFSREESKKVYVQHLMAQKDNALSLIEDLDSGGSLYVCGATAMGTDVHEALIGILQKHKGMSNPTAQKFVKDLQTSGRYVQELWST